jgi:hypothetical protein
MDIRTSGEYSTLNDFRGAHGYILFLPKSQVDAVKSTLKSFDKQYSYIPTNCTTPIQDALYAATGFGAIGASGERRIYVSPAALDDGIRSNFHIENVKYYQVDYKKHPESKP